MLTNKTSCPGYQYHYPRLMISLAISSERINLGLVSMPLNHNRPSSNGLIFLSKEGNLSYRAISLKIAGIFKPASVKKRTVVKNLEIFISVGLGIPLLS